MVIKNVKRLALSVILSMAMIFGQALPAHAFVHEGKSIDGIQVGNVFYSMEYIIANEVAFGDIFGPAAAETVVLDFNGKSAKFSDYLSGGVSDFDEFASIPANQTAAAPNSMLDGSGNTVAISPGGGETESNSVTSVYSTGNTSAEVAFKNALEAAEYVKEKFSFNNGLTVESSNIKSGSGNKTVVLTTSSQDSSKTYTLTYDGKAVSETFKGTAIGTTVPPAPSIPSTPVDDDNKLQGLDSEKTYQYKEVGSDNWIDYNPESGLPETVEGKDILVREKETATTPPGTPIEVSVPGDSQEDIEDGDTQRNITKVVAYNEGSEIDTVTVTFDKAFFPSEKVYLSDFEVKRSIDSGAYSQRLSTANLKISADRKSASFGVQSVSKQLDEQSVKYSVSYKGASTVDAGSAVIVPAVLTYIESYSIKAIEFAGNDLHEIKVTVKSGVADVKVNGKKMNYKGSKEFILYTTELVGQSSAQIKLYASDGSELESKTINVPFS
ncbi:hypothetical protein SAMN02745945_02824 [Peptoclostridium litorale DSM 5388]|uniref:Uncharacterized protein n=1 Tax=Peptoclostridium litorale DSM 5388 TaxID=1121324 RepID=A0A069RDW3_PEPLI|nr:hypothetical protein [Peptoclostridium litorale]KDR94938.1 hypothetical protein CLIT_12c00060 [Peptoclostridium litorale DSM 5388]SIO34055.1 hypothetical protein SAMN02745945_02824 [Peptoclostridium litorale DSM 5388]